MRTTVLPLPTGRFIIVASTQLGMPLLTQGAPTAYTGPALAHTRQELGWYTWKGIEHAATLFATYHQAQQVVDCILADRLAFLPPQPRNYGVQMTA